LSGGHQVAGLHIDAAQVAIHRHEALAVIDEDGLAVEEEIARFQHAPGGGIFDRGTRRGRNVHARVRVARLAIEDPAQSERARTAARHRRRQSPRGREPGRIRAECRFDAAALGLDALQVLRWRVDMTRVDLQALLVVLFVVDDECDVATRPRRGPFPAHQLSSGRRVEGNADDGNPAAGTAHDRRAMRAEVNGAGVATLHLEWQHRESAGHADIGRQRRRIARGGHALHRAAAQQSNEQCRTHGHGQGFTVVSGGMICTTVARKAPRASRAVTVAPIRDVDASVRTAPWSSSAMA
jgi:hypothetical protein